MNTKSTYLLAAVAILATAIFFQLSSDQSTQPSAPPASESRPQTVERADLSVTVGAPRLEIGSSLTDNTDAKEMLVHIASGPSGSVAVSGYVPTEVEQISDFAAAYDNLVARAQAGDVDAAYSLFKNLQLCSLYRFESDTELEQALESLYSNYSYVSPSGSTTYISSTGDSSNPEGINVDEEARFIRSNHERCDGISKAQIAQATEFLKRASEGGMITATKQLIGLTPPGSELRELYATAWASGDLLSLPGYASELLADYDDAPADPAAAYYHLVLLTSIIQSTGSDSLLAQRVFDNAWQLQQQAAGQVTLSEYGVAAEEAYKLLVENENCCIFPRALMPSISVADSQ